MPQIFLLVLLELGGLFELASDPVKSLRLVSLPLLGFLFLFLHLEPGVAC